ncbi:hypothetical protein L4O28_005377 [Pseudomonas aeruginosa]|nr:hypothetical protein [Pseudomonas aeruginosa]
MTISNRFPSGASLDQVKKDAKKLAKSNGLSLHEALDQAAAAHGAQVPWHRIQEFLAGDDDETLLARFALPLYAGGVFTVSLTETRPMISVTGRTGAGKSTTALLIAERYLASCRGRVHLVSPLHVGVWGAMEPKTNVSSESHRKGAFRSPAHPPGITL